MANQEPLATVNGKEIYPEDLNQLIVSFPPEQQIQFGSREGRRALLEELIAQELLYAEAKEAKLDETEDFKKLLKEAEENLLKQTALLDFMKLVTVTDDEIEAYYNDNPEQFVAPESIRASHILVDDLETAEEVTKELENGDISFEEAAVKYSKCPSAQQGGDLSYFQKGQMVPEFEEAAFALEPGQMTEEPVQTQFGYHIIKQTDHKKDEVMPFEIVKEQLRPLILAQKQNEAYQKHVEELKEKYPVELNLGMI